MKVLVTGGAGRVGAGVCSALLHDQHEVVVLDPADPRAVLEGLEHVQAPTSDVAALRRAMKGVDAVVHLAGFPKYDPDKHDVLVETNFVGTYAVLDAAAAEGVRKLVFASSICAYGFIFWHERETPTYFPVDEDHPCRPSDLYGLTKLQGEQLCAAYSARYGLDTICLRLATVWFPDFAEPTRRFVDRIKKPEESVDFIWNYVDLRDVVQAFRLALEYEGRGHHVFNIGADETSTETASLDLVRKFFPETPTLRSTDDLLHRPNAPLYSIAKAKQILGYLPKHTWREYLALSETAP